MVKEPLMYADIAGNAKYLTQGKKVEESIKIKGASEAHEMSNRWQVKFSILEKAGADKKTLYKMMGSQEYKNLTTKEKYKVQFNLPAFLFGPLYYFCKKMWAKGIVLLGFLGAVIALIMFIEAVVQITLPVALFWIVPAIFMAQTANYDYYRHMKHGDKKWKNMPRFLSKPKPALLAPTAALILLAGMFTLTPRFSQAIDALALEKVSGVWLAGSDGTRISIDLSGNQKVLRISGSTIPVSIRDIDNKNNTIIFSVNLSDNRQVLWTLHQVFNESGQATLFLTIHDGAEESLSFIRKL